MDKIGPAIFAVAFILAIFALMAVGWRNRKRSQAEFPALPEIPALADPLLSVEGQYVASTRAGDWLDRIAVQGLGVRTRAKLTLFPEGVLIERAGFGDLYLARTAIVEVRTESGMAGKFVEKSGLIVLCWQLGEQLLDTGFRTRHAEDRSPLLAALTELVPANAPTPNAATPDLQNTDPQNLDPQNTEKNG